MKEPINQPTHKSAFSVTQIILTFTLVIFLFGTGYKLGEAKAQNFIPFLQSAPIRKDLDLTLFWQVLAQVQTKYIDKTKLDPKKMVYGAIKGMVASLDDPYTFFLTPEENKQSKDTLGGRFEGVGMELGLKDNRIIVVAPKKNTPAERAGAQPGDYILKVDGTSTQGWTLTQAVSKIRGQKGTSVTLTMGRGEKQIDLTMTRDVIKLESVTLTYETKKDCPQNCKKVARLQLDQFGDSAEAEWNVAVNEISKKWKNKEIEGMVLDLRNNPGGYLESAVYIASEFLPRNNIVVKQESTTEGNREYTVDRNGKLLNIPLTVLINKGSASASEILSGTLRDYGRAKLVGEKSFGKGSVQETGDLPQGAGLHITIAKWLLPKGDWINQKGIEPDIVIENKIPDGNTQIKENDAQLEKAIELLVQ